MFKRDEVPLLKLLSPFPFKRGRGIQGDGVRTIIIDNSELVARNGIISQMQIVPYRLALLITLLSVILYLLLGIPEFYLFVPQS